MASRAPSFWKQAKARAGFLMHLRTYVFVNGVLWLIWLILSFIHREHWGSYPWPIWSTFIWGIGLVSHYFSVYHGFNAKNLTEREYKRLTQKELRLKTRE